ncbi:MAG: aminotransferase class V-fold PLP-dependent enzyme [Chthonomonas sp.]|nr:aminotransferase class V-fold PLP-dependent enzyme [Chthonomonas sp.]
MTLSPPDIAAIRSRFPSLAQDFAFFENAGGSQLPGVVIDAMTQFMRSDYVNIGGMYPASERATKVAREAHSFLNLMFNGVGLGHVAMGPSSTALLYMLANCIGETLSPGDEVIVSVANHECNVGPWVRLASRGVVVKWWGVHPTSGLSSIEELEALVTERTKVVAFPRTSNLLGDIVDVQAVSRAAHRVGAIVVADVVASASHEAMDVRAWECDFCVFSNYKVYGPHAAAMFGTTEAWAKLSGPNHFFIKPSGSAAKFELGCISYEACAGILALADYLRFLVGEPNAATNRALIEGGFGRMSELEKPLKTRLMTYLASRDDIKIWGSAEPEADRHPTISFVHKTKDSSELCRMICDRGFGIKSGHMYAYRLCESLGISTDTGVVRISAVHTNSMDEIERLIAVLDEVL